jgi:flagellin
MSFSIRTNVASITAQNNLSSSQSKLTNTMNQLSSGERITSAADDAAGLGISTNLEAQIASYSQATRNASDGTSLVQTAEGFMNGVSNILTRLRELAMESASDGVGNTQRGFIDTEAKQLQSELDRISSTAEYNGTKLRDGTASNLNFQVGIRGTSADAITVNMLSMNVSIASLGVSTASVNLSSLTGAQAALASIDKAIDNISQQRSVLGALANRFASVSDTIASASQNLSAADSRIRDVDVTSATADLARENVLTQAGVAVLAQANQVPQMTLKLLG